MQSLIGFSGLLLVLLIVSGLGTAIDTILQKKVIWIPSLVILLLSCAASGLLLILIGQIS